MSWRKFAKLREAWALSKRIRVRVHLHEEALVFPLSTPREAIPCSVVMSECGSVNLRIPVRDYSRRSQHWNARTFSVAAQNGEAWGSFLSWVVLLWGVKLKNLKGLWGVGFKMPAQCCKTAGPPSQVINDQPPSFEFQTGDLDNPPDRALFKTGPQISVECFYYAMLWHVLNVLTFTGSCNPTQEDSAGSPGSKYPVQDTNTWIVCPV